MLSKPFRMECIKSLTFCVLEIVKFINVRYQWYRNHVLYIGQIKSMSMGQAPVTAQYDKY